MSAEQSNGQRHVVIVGGGFAGVGCARRLAGHDDVRVTLIDRNNYHQFQPLLYQVATSPARRRATSRTRCASCSTTTRTSTSSSPRSRGRPGGADGHDGRRRAHQRRRARAGRRARSRTSSTRRAPRSTRSRSTRSTTRSGCAPASSSVFEEADRDPSLVAQGALNFVVVGGGPTGVEIAGALADMIHETMTGRVPRRSPSRRRRSTSSTSATTLLGPFSDKAHDYVAKVLTAQGRRSSTSASASTRSRPATSSLADGTVIRPAASSGAAASRRRRSPPSAACRAGAAGASTSRPDLTVDGAPGVYAVGDVANIPAPDGGALPQLGSVALQSGRLGGRQHPRRRRRQAAQAVPLPRQGHHGDDRPRRRGRRGRASTATSCTARSRSRPGSACTPR